MCGFCGVITSGTLCRDFVEDERLNLLVREEVQGQANIYKKQNGMYAYEYVHIMIYVLYEYLYISYVYMYITADLYAISAMSMSPCLLSFDMGFCQILSVRYWDVGLSRRGCNGRCFNTMAPLPAAF